jgi:hypothetical protein
MQWQNDRGACYNTRAPVIPVVQAHLVVAGPIILPFSDWHVFGGETDSLLRSISFLVDLHFLKISFRKILKKCIYWI